MSTFAVFRMRNISLDVSWKFSRVCSHRLSSKSNLFICQHWVNFVVKASCLLINICMESHTRFNCDDDMELLRSYYWIGIRDKWDEKECSHIVKAVLSEKLVIDAMSSSSLTAMDNSYGNRKMTKSKKIFDL